MSALIRSSVREVPYTRVHTTTWISGKCDGTSSLTCGCDRRQGLMRTYERQYLMKLSIKFWTERDCMYFGLLP